LQAEGDFQDWAPTESLALGVVVLLLLLLLLLTLVLTSVLDGVHDVALAAATLVTCKVCSHMVAVLAAQA
jgi:hypothetical protein